MTDDAGKRLEQVRQELTRILEERLQVLDEVVKKGQGAGFEGELGQILKQRLEELDDVVRKAESIARRIVSAELELERHRSSTERLESDLTVAEKTLVRAKVRVEELRLRESIVNEERDRLQGEVRKHEADLAAAEADAEKARARMQELDGESDSLRTETASLRTKQKTLEENIARMKKLKEELMSSISGLTEQMTGLAGGGTE